MCAIFFLTRHLGTGLVRPVSLSASSRGHPEVDQSHVAVFEPENRTSVSRLMGTLLSPILQYVCHRRGARNSGPRRFICLRH